MKALAPVTGIAILLFATGCSPKVDVKPLKSQPLAEVKDYKQWKEVTIDPVLVDESFLISCIGPPETVTESEHPFAKTAELKTEHGTQKISQTGYIRVFVNELGESAMMNERQPVFPAGTIIVKAKQPDSGFKSFPTDPVEHLTVMRKLHPNESPRTEDWEYLVFVAESTKPVKNHNLPDCFSCHIKWKNTDYVSREYMTKEQLANLR